MPNKRVFLTGYEKESIDNFLSRIKNNGVTIIVDVREIPLSRKKGFSKNTLRENLAEVGIDYTHIKELGSPKNIRTELKNKGNYLTFFKKYRAYIKGKHIELQKIINLTQKETICIMCFEKDCELCHRTIVAAEMLKIVPTLNILPI